MSFFSAIFLGAIEYAGVYTSKECSASFSGSDISSTLSSKIFCEVLKPSMIFRHAFGLLTSFLFIIIILSVLKPLEDLVEGRPPTLWSAHLSAQVWNSVKLYFLELFVELVSFLPLIVMLLLLVPDVLSLLSGGVQAQDQLLPLLLKSLIALLAGLLMMLVVRMVLTLLLTFTRIEIVLTGRGLISAVRSSVSLCRRNLGEIFVFHLLWLVLSIFAGLAVLVTCCLALFIAPLMAYLLIMPVRLLSEIIFWKRLKAGKKTPLPEEQVKKAVQASPDMVGVQ